MSPIYSYLGANDSELPLLWLAGPMTGLIIQPIVGAMSDKTITPYGRRRPYFLIGAIFCSICLLAMPFSSSVWMAASILWILDAANNITQEPYRAFVSDKLDKEQHSLGFLTQSAFTGLGQTLSYITPTLLIFLGVSMMDKSSSGIPFTTYIAFFIGAVVSIGSIVYTLFTTKEIPLTEDEKNEIRKNPLSIKSVLSEIFEAIKTMPNTMKRMIPMMFFSWYAMFIFWQYMAKCLSKTIFMTTDSGSEGFRKGELLFGQMGAFYNFIAFVGAFLLATLAVKYGPKIIHAICLALAGISLIIIPQVNESSTIFFLAIAIGLSWASMMGNPYIMLAGSIPKERTGTYMGIFNLFIVLPMLIETFTLPMYYKSLLGDNPQNAIILAGVLLVLGALSTYFIKYDHGAEIAPQTMVGGGH